MTEPYVAKKPNDVIRADDWNTAQIRAREHILDHRHSGEPHQGRQLDETAISAEAELTVKSVSATKELRVNGREILAELDALKKGLQQALLKDGPLGDVVGDLHLRGALLAYSSGSSGIFMGPWQADPDHFAIIGSGALNHGSRGNYALRVSVDSRDDPVTHLNSPSTISFRIGDEEKILLTNSGQLCIGTATPVEKAKLTVEGDVSVSRSLFWARSQLREDQGGSLELGGNNNIEGAGTPYIDFHYKEKTQDYNVRLMNDADGVLSLLGSPSVALKVNGTVEASVLAAPSLRLTRRQQWVEVTAFQNGWHHFGDPWAKAAYFKDELGFVHLRGLIGGGTFFSEGGSSGTIFELPPGYRPQVRYLRGFRFAPLRVETESLKKEIQDAAKRGDAIRAAQLSVQLPALAQRLPAETLTEPHRIDVIPNGVVAAASALPYQDNGWLSLDGITFAAAD